MDSEDYIVCEICKDEVSQEHCVGCCNGDNCQKKIETMCDSCSTWYDREEVWLCADCVVLKEEVKKKLVNASISKFFKQ